MLDRKGYDDLVARLYASAGGQGTWEATLAQFADQFGASALAFHVHDAAFKPVSAKVHGYSKEFSDQFYASGGFARDPRVARFAKVPPGSVYYDHMLYDVSEMERDPRVRETIDALKVKYQLGTILRLPNQTIGSLALLSTPEEGHASPSAIASFRRLAPHIEQASALGLVIEVQALTQRALLDALALKADAVIILDGAGVPVFMNEGATQILSADDGLRYRAGAFITRRPPETRKLLRAVGDAIAMSLRSGEKPGGQLLITRPSGKRPYVLRVMPAPQIELFLGRQSLACVMHIQDLAKIHVPSRESLIVVFGLTEREADLAIALMQCTGLESAAADTRMAVNTARNHLQSVFRKTGTGNQAAAVQLLGRLV